MQCAPQIAVVIFVEVRVKANSHIPCRAHAVSMPFRAALIHTCHAAPLNYQISICFSYRIAPSTVHSISISTWEAIWNKLFPTELPQPTEEEWKKKEKELYSLWQFFNCIGAAGSKHIQIQAPHNSGSLFFDYKKEICSSVGIGRCQL